MRKTQPIRNFLKHGLFQLLCFILVTLGITSCQLQSTENPEPTTVASPALNIVTATFPSSATVACVPLQPGMSVNITPVSHVSVKVDLKGFQPGENVTFIFSTEYGTTKNRFTAGPVQVKKDGSYSLNESLSVEPDRSKIHWQVQVVYSRGAICTELDMPALSTLTTPISQTCHKIAFVIYSNTKSDIFSACPDGSSRSQLTRSTIENTSPAWSPDGTKIAFVSGSNKNSQIYVMDESGENPVRMTSDQVNDYPIWLPDGKRIAFRTTDTKGLWWWRVIDLTSHEVIKLSEPSFDFFFETPAWSPDGKQMVYMSMAEQKSRNDGASQIHVKAIDGSNDIALTKDTWANINPVWSRNGTKIAFLSKRDGAHAAFALYVMAKDGTQLKRLTDPLFSYRVTISWSPDGQEIAISADIVIKDIAIFDVATGKTRNLLTLADGESASMPSWQP